MYPVTMATLISLARPSGLYFTVLRPISTKGDAHERVIGCKGGHGDNIGIYVPEGGKSDMQCG